MKLTRRRFFRSIIDYLPVIAVGSLSYPFFRFILFSEGLKREKVLIPIKRLVSIVTKFSHPPMFIVKEKNNKLLALDSHCTHMGCIVNYDPDKNIFICPCHGSEYNIDGVNIRGPTKRPLHKEPVKIIDDKVVVDYIYYKIS